MKNTLTIILAIITLNLSAQTLRQQLLKSNPNLEGLQIIKCKADPSLFIAILERHTDWWESINIVKFQKGKIAWTARFDTLPHHNLSVRQDKFY